MPLALTYYFSRNDTIHNIIMYNTSYSTKLYINYKRTNFGKISIKYRVAKIWNSLPAKLKDISESKYIKNKKQILLHYMIIV